MNGLTEIRSANKKASKENLLRLQRDKLVQAVERLLALERPCVPLSVSQFAEKALYYAKHGKE